MRVLLCSDVQLGALCADALPVELSHKWQAARTRKLADLIDKAAQKNAGYIALFGRLFGQTRVSESVIDTLFDAVREDGSIRVLAFLESGEYSRVSYRSDIPANLHLLRRETGDSFDDGKLMIQGENGNIRLQPAGGAPVVIGEGMNGAFTVRGPGFEAAVPSFEPVGFEDAQGKTAGYAVLTWNDRRPVGCETVGDQRFAFRTQELRIRPTDGQKDIARMIQAAAAKIDADTFLRVSVTGRSAFGITISGDALAKQLQNRIFFVEVYDNTIMDIDEEAFENDISLRSEFVRLAMQDDSLSESERNRVISCGWNALNGEGADA